MTAVLLSDWLSDAGGNAISLNRDARTFSIWEQKILLICLSAKGELKMKSDLKRRSLFFSPCEGRDVSVKTSCLCDWPSSKQRCIDANASPLAPRPVLTNALLGGFVQLEWLQHLAEIYSAVRETGLSEGDELLCRQEVLGSDPRGPVCEPSESLFIRRSGLFTGRIMNAYVGRRQSERFRRSTGGWGWPEMGVFLHRVWNKKIHYPPKVKGTQMANLHSAVATAGGWMLMAQFLMQFFVKREKYHTFWC